MTTAITLISPIALAVNYSWHSPISIATFDAFNRAYPPHLGTNGRFENGRSQAQYCESYLALVGTENRRFLHHCSSLLSAFYSPTGTRLPMAHLREGQSRSLKTSAAIAIPKISQETLAEMVGTTRWCSTRQVRVAFISATSICFGLLILVTVDKEIVQEMVLPK
jgi:hypothetical protein